MYLEAKETARLYKLLSDKLGSDTTEAMFKYIDNKTERSVEATIKTLATKDDFNSAITGVREDLNSAITGVRKDLNSAVTGVREDLNNAVTGIRADMAKLSKENGETRAEMIKWMFIFWAGQLAVMLTIIVLILKR